MNRPIRGGAANAILAALVATDLEGRATWTFRYGM